MQEVEAGIVEVQLVLVVLEEVGQQVLVLAEVVQMVLLILEVEEEVQEAGHLVLEDQVLLF
jgi:hypothetical protein